MAFSDLRAGLALRLRTIPGIGVVNDWEPYATREEDFATFFVSEGLLLGWTICRESTHEGHITRALHAADHLFVIRGYRAVDNDAQSEKGFQDLVELARAALRIEQDPGFHLGGAAVKVDHPQLRIVEPRLFGGVLVHYAEIAIIIEEALP